MTFDNIWTVADTFTFAIRGFTSIADNDVDVDADADADADADDDVVFIFDLEDDFEVEAGMMNAAV